MVKLTTSGTHYLSVYHLLEHICQDQHKMIKKKIVPRAKVKAIINYTRISKNVERISIYFFLDLFSYVVVFFFSICSDFSFL